LLVDDLVHQVLDAFVCSHEARQFGQAGAVSAVAHLVLEQGEVVVEAVCGRGKQRLVGRGGLRSRSLRSGRSLLITRSIRSFLSNRSLLRTLRNLIILSYLIIQSWLSCLRLTLGDFLHERLCGGFGELRGLLRLEVPPSEECDGGNQDCGDRPKEPPTSPPRPYPASP